MTDDNNSAPANQDTPPEDKLYGGKFKSVEDMERAYEEAVRGQSSLMEENQRMQSYIAMLDQPATSVDATPPPVPVDPTGNGEVDPAVAQYVSQAVSSAITQNNQQAQKATEAEQRFYSKYPDLRDQHDLVLFHTMRLKQESVGRRPPLTLDQAIEEVAKRVRQQIAQIRGTETPPHTEGGSKTGRQTPPNTPPPPETDEERLAAYTAETRKRKTKQMLRKG